MKRRREGQQSWRRFTYASFVFGLLLAVGKLANSSAFAPRQLPCKYTSTTTRLLDANEKGIDDTEIENSDIILDYPLSQVKQLAKKGSSDVNSVVGAAGSGFKSAVGAAGSGVKSAAGAATSGISQLAEKGGSGIKSAVGATVFRVKSVAGAATGLATSGVKSVAGAASSGVKTVADATTSGISRLTEKTTSDVKTVASGLTGLAQKGSSNVKSIATVAGSSLTGLAEKGAVDTSTLIQWLDVQAKGTASAARDTAGAATMQAKAVAKELISRATSSDYSLSDVMLLLKVLLAIGASIGPLAKILPVTVLLQMLNVSLEARLGGTILEALAGSLDERVTAAISAEELGDLAKRSLTGAILAFTGKETYERGDIERAVAKETACEDTVTAPGEKTLELSVGPEFAQWDEAFRKSHPDVELVVAESVNNAGQNSGGRPRALDSQVVSELEEWDRMFRERYPDARL